ncbi:MAG TPA: agmatinase, partial [Terriglobales bacterium]|nr:agmatinase [Terriglobales bacterium]
TYRPGARFGPRNIRVQSAMIRPWNPVLEVNPFHKWRIADFGDLSINPLSIEDTYGRITAQLKDVLRAKAHPVSVGGDHSILLPILRAIHHHHGPVGLLQLDAHGDTWGGYFGSPHSHGTPVKYAVEEGLIAKGYALQVGLRGQVYSDGDFDFARKHQIQIVTCEEFHQHGTELLQRHLRKLANRPVYVTLDIDVVDPAFAPGTGTPQIGGLSSAQILEVLHCFKDLNLVGCDLVEVSPPYDNGEITSLLAANLLFELLCLF